MRSLQVHALADGIHPGALAPGARLLLQQLRQHPELAPGRWALAIEQP